MRKRLASRWERKPSFYWWPRAELNHRHKDFSVSAGQQPQPMTTRSHNEINELKSSTCCREWPVVVVCCRQVSHERPMKCTGPFTRSRASATMLPSAENRTREPKGFSRPQCASRFRDARVEDAISTATRRLDRSDVDLLHLHHCIERALGGGGIGIGDRFRQGDRRNLPGQSPFVLAQPHALSWPPLPTIA